jgi:hypothetical protein
LPARSARSPASRPSCARTARSGQSIRTSPATTRAPRSSSRPAAGTWPTASSVSDGDLEKPGEERSIDPLLAAYPAYPNGWIAAAAQRLGRFEVSEPTWAHLKSYLHPDLGGCCIEGPHEPGASRHVDTLLTAHLGLCALYFGHGEIAHRAEQLLVRFLDQQPEPTTRLLLRMNDRGELVKEFDEEHAFRHQVVADAPDQGWFFIAYPIAFLGLLHRVTTSGEALRAARGYLDFALACPALPSDPRAHQVAWAAAILGEITESPRYFDLSMAIARSLIAGQGSSGLWRDGEVPPHTCFEQSAETALWLLEIARVAPIATRPERSRAEVSTTTAHRRGVGAWSLRHQRTADPHDDA